MYDFWDSRSAMKTLSDLMIQAILMKKKMLFSGVLVSSATSSFRRKWFMKKRSNQEFQLPARTEETSSSWAALQTLPSHGFMWNQQQKPWGVKGIFTFSLTWGIPCASSLHLLSALAWEKGLFRRPLFPFLRTGERFHLAHGGSGAQG